MAARRDSGAASAANPRPNPDFPDFDCSTTIPAMRKRQLLFVLTLASIAGCNKSQPKPPEIGTILPNLPLPPQAQALVREGGAEAMQFLFVTPVSPDSVVAYYRDALSTGVFHLINESVTGKSTAFYAEQNGPSIWVTVSPNGSDGSQVMIAGATPKDSVTMGAKKP